MKKKKQMKYTLGLSLVAILFLYAAYQEAPRLAALRTGAMLAGAAVGATAAVAPNSYNTLAQQLEQKQADLLKQEAELTARQTRETSAPWMRDLPLYSFLMSLALLLLIGVNFYFDWRRRPLQATFPRAVVNLRERQ